MTSHRGHEHGASRALGGMEQPSVTSRIAPTEVAVHGTRGWAVEPLTDGKVGGRSPRFRTDLCNRCMLVTELLT